MHDSTVRTPTHRINFVRIQVELLKLTRYRSVDAHTDMSVILSAMMANSEPSFDRPRPSSVVPIFNTKSHLLKPAVPLSHIMRLTPMTS